ncbi:MAG: hypothetical protein AAFW84_29265 [Cyanobacteria bacterium J06635_15]
MTKQLLTALLTANIVVGGLASPLVAQDSAQDSVSSLIQMLESLGQRCNRATEVSYQSERLSTTDGGTEVYVEGLLRKIVAPNSPLRQGDSAEYCYPDVRETVIRELVINNNGETRRITMDAYDQGYLIYSPRSFSADGRYLVADLQIAYTGGDPGAQITLFDLDNSEVVSTSEVCQNFDFENYIGFISPTEFAVHCMAYGDMIEGFEVIDVQSGEVRQLSARPTSVTDYGVVEGELEVTKTQIFH